MTFIMWNDCCIFRIVLTKNKYYEKYSLVSCRNLYCDLGFRTCWDRRWYGDGKSDPHIIGDCGNRYIIQCNFGAKAAGLMSWFSN